MSSSIHPCLVSANRGQVGCSRFVVVDSLAMAGSLTPGILLADTYRIVRLIGRGDMGRSTRRRTPGARAGAVKVLLAEMVGRDDVFQRFRCEAEVTSAIRHPNIIQVLDFNLTPDGHPYLVMEYLDGVELSTELHRMGGRSSSSLTACCARRSSARPSRC
jgi:serine/threonine protein kinase